MSLTTFSVFYYGHEITSENNLLDFDEGLGTLTAAIPVGKYTLTSLAVAVRDALNQLGDLTYTVSVDREARRYTIQASGTFSLLVQTGPSVGTSVFSLIGFTGADRTGASSYQSNATSGFEYRPQFILQSYVPKENFKRTVQAAVNESASGEVEVVRFGANRFTQFEINFITDLKMDGRVIRNNPQGVYDANHFMDYITRIAPIEFMPNVNDRNTYQTLQLESTPQSRDGIDYQLRELYDRGLPFVFQTGLLVFRVLD